MMREHSSHNEQVKAHRLYSGKIWALTCALSFASLYCALAIPLLKFFGCDNRKNNDCDYAFRNPDAYSANHCTVTPTVEKNCGEHSDCYSCDITCTPPSNFDALHLAAYEDCKNHWVSNFLPVALGLGMPLVMLAGALLSLCIAPRYYYTCSRPSGSGLFSCKKVNEPVDPNAEQAYQLMPVSQP